MMPIETRSAMAGPILTCGFGMTVAVWVVAFITHLPWLNLPQDIAGPIVLGAWVVAAIIAARAVPQHRAITIMAMAGGLCALLTLMVLGSLLVEPIDAYTPAPGTSGLMPSATRASAGFVLLGCAIGTASGLFRKGVVKPAQPPHTHIPSLPQAPTVWLARLSVVAAASVVPLLIIGGTVTSTRSGMAIIGWPDSYGANMFLYPISLMAHPQRFLEHTHRLFGALVGLTTLALLVYTLVSKVSRHVMIAAGVLFVLVVVQGLLGAKRVIDGAEAITTRQSELWAMFHGVLAQLFFAGMVAFAAVVNPRYRTGLTTTEPASSRLHVLAWWLLGATVFQLVMGAAYRHLHQPHALWTHAVFSLAVVILASIAGAKVKRAGINAEQGSRAAAAATTLRAIGSGLTHVVGIQFLLGWVALWAVMTGGERRIPIGDEVNTAPQTPIVQAVVRTIHQANGALVLALVTLALVWTLWLKRPRPQ